MTAREFIAKWPHLPVDLSEFIAAHGLDAELPPLDNTSYDPEPTMRSISYDRKTGRWIDMTTGKPVED